MVIARGSSFACKGKAVDLRQVGEELGVSYVVAGWRKGAYIDPQYWVPWHASSLDPPRGKFSTLDNQLFTSVRAYPSTPSRSSGGTRWFRDINHQ